MSIPGPNKLTVSPVVATFESLIAGQIVSLLEDWELGGIGIQDPSQGLRVQTWRGYVSTNGKSILISAPNTAAITKYTASGTNTISEVSITFDQNMRPIIAFVESGVPKLQWYDSVSQTEIVTTLALDVRSPRVSLDNKRRFFEVSSDVILAYIRGGNLYIRQQRDRYTIEYLLKTGVPTDYYLHKIGPSIGLRFQFELWKDWVIYANNPDSETLALANAPSPIVATTPKTADVVTIIPGPAS